MRPDFQGQRITLGNNFLKGVIGQEEFSQALRELEDVEATYDETEHARALARHDAATSALVRAIVEPIERVTAQLERELRDGKLDS